MTAPGNAIRVFISSTFRDMQAERDHLVTVVFPELRERAERLGLEFFDVDLRWGVPAKDLNGETANSWEYCRQWIDRVEPLFACILGQRYGWVPEREDFKAESDRARQAAVARSITDLEVRYAVLDERRKRRSYFYLRQTPVPALSADATEERRLLQGEFVDPPEQLAKLETLKAEVQRSTRPVRSYECHWNGRGFDDLDAFGRLVLEDLWSGVLRDPRYVSKETWRQALGADPDSDPRYIDESRPIPQELWQSIVALAKPAPVSPLDAERQQMATFAASRLNWFQGRGGELRTLTGFVRSTDESAPRLAVVVGPSGQGKSALLARFWGDLTSLDQSAVPDAAADFVIAHFVGATERSASAVDLVRRLLDELDQSGIPWPDDESEEEPKRDFDSLCARLSKRLGTYAGRRRIVLLIDALNQLSDGHDLLWLPQQFGTGVRAVVSCVEDPAANEGSPEQRTRKAIRDRYPGSLEVPLGPLKPEEIRTVVTEYLQEYCKELDPPHLDALCALPQACNPLYLLVALRELRTLGGNDINRKIPQLIASLPQRCPDTTSLFKWVLQGVEVFGETEVKHWCLYLALGRAGMASRELADLLRRRSGDVAASKALLIERGLRPYLQRRGGQLDFFHGQLRQAVLERYQEEGSVETRESAVSTLRLHRDMAEYFAACARGDDRGTPWETDAVRGFSECVHHFIRANDCDHAQELVSNFPFLLHKTRVGLLEGVFEDYALFRRCAPPEAVAALEFHAAFFREKAHILRRGNEKWPAHKILLQLAVEHADDSPLTIGAEQWLAEGHGDWYWLRSNRRPSQAQVSPCLAVFEGHSGPARGVLVLSDGRILSWSRDASLRIWDGNTGKCLTELKGGSSWGVSGAVALEDGRLLSWGGPSLRIWDSRSGQCLTVFREHVGDIGGALALPEGRILSWTDSEIDSSLRIWNGRSGNCLAVLDGHEWIVSGAAVLPDGNIVSWSKYETFFRVWDSQSGRCVAVLKEHGNSIRGVLALSEAQFLSYSSDRTLRLWDSTSLTCLATFEGHSRSVTGAIELTDGLILSWSFDHTLRLWDRQIGTCLAILEGHSGPLAGATELPDGRILSWAGRYDEIGEHNPTDYALRIWDRASGKCLNVLDGHSAYVHGARVMPDGRILSWSEDHTLRLWDSRSGKCLVILEGHSGAVSDAVVLSDGRIASCSDDGTLRLWMDAPSILPASAERHSGEVVGTLVLPDGHALSWARDKTLRVWDSQSGRCVFALEGHAESIGGALLLPDNRVLSWSNDKSLRIWDCGSGKCLAVLEGHPGRVVDALLLSNGRIVSRSGGLFSMDYSLFVWESRSGECRGNFIGHTHRVRGFLAMPEGRVLSWAEDGTLRIWDSYYGTCRAVLTEQGPYVEDALLLPDGRILSQSLGHDLRMWDGQSGERIAELEGSAGASAAGALVLPQSRILSWTADQRLHIWDSWSGKRLAALEGHSGAVGGALVLSDGRIASWAEDQTLRIWDEEGRPIAVHSIDDGLFLFSEVRAAYGGNERTRARCILAAEANSAVLRHFEQDGALDLRWHGNSRCAGRYLFADGRAIVTQDDGEVCFLHLYRGDRPISIDDISGLRQGESAAAPRPASPYVHVDQVR